MALVVSDEVEKEARRILSCKSPFEILEVNPRECGKEQVLKQYNAKAELFKRAFRNKLAVQAKAKVDDAKMRLLDEKLRATEIAAFNMTRSTEQREASRIHALEARTRMLEMRAEDAKQRMQTAAQSP